VREVAVADDPQRHKTADLEIPLLVSTYDSAGALTSVTLFGIDVTFLFE
jgi:hypothetical protein